jgi:hypothetical protein
MTLHRLKARLKKLERAMSVAENDPDPARTFVIDPAVAKALRDDYERELNLFRRQHGPNQYGAKLSAAEMEEKSRLSISIKERARAIGCPASYGRVQQDIDSKRLDKAELKRFPNWAGPCMTAAEDAEEAQARARMLAFGQTPEQLARQRIEELDRIDGCGGRRRTAVEQQELDDLRRRYPPEPEGDITQDPTYPAILALQREIAERKLRNANVDDD